MRAMVVASTLTQGNPPVREAGLGWLLAESPVVRRAVIAALAQGATAGAMSGVALRRVIALRNWLPQDERGQLDAAIKAARKKTDCASWPEAQDNMEMLATGIDGVGAQSVLIIVAQGRKRAMGSILLKHGFGVREAFVQHELPKREADRMLKELSAEMPLSRMNIDVLGPLLRHHLGVNAQSGVMPPFGLLDVAEAAGLADLNPRHLDLDALLEELFSDIGPEALEPDALAETVADWESLEFEEPLIGSWFEDSDEAAAIFKGKKVAKTKRKAALMAILGTRRRWWAELLAWTAWNVQHRAHGGEWEAFAVVARELLGDRPIEQFGIMTRIADATIEFHTA
jgi:hypothetical protein